MITLESCFSRDDDHKEYLFFLPLIHPHCLPLDCPRAQYWSCASVDPKLSGSPQYLLKQALVFKPGFQGPSPSGALTHFSHIFAQPEPLFPLRGDYCLPASMPGHISHCAHDTLSYLSPSVKILLSL